MSVDPELKSLLNALVDGQIKLAEGLSQLGARIDQRLEQIDRRIDQVDKRMDRFEQRMREYTGAVMRKLTEVTDTNMATTLRIDAIEDRVAALEEEHRS